MKEQSIREMIAHLEAQTEQLRDARRGMRSMKCFITASRPGRGGARRR